MKNSSVEIATSPSAVPAIVNLSVEEVRMNTLALVKDTYQNASLETLRRQGKTEQIAVVEESSLRWTIAIPKPS